jgi:photosystem II stability/assembly factor-like uncharacterized protein
VARIAAAGAAVLIAAVIAASGSNAAATARPFFVWLHMTSAQDGYALSGTDSRNYRLLHTTDGGRVWYEIVRSGHAIHQQPEIEGGTIIFSRTVGYRTFAIERSGNGGHTWSESLPFHNKFGLGAGTPRRVDPEHLYVSVGEGVAAGSEGEALYTSSDGGRRWRLMAQTNVNRTPPGGLPFGCDKNGFGFATPSRGWASGYCAGGSAFFLRTNDGGRRWRRQNLPDMPRNCQCNTSTPLFFGRRVGVVWTSGVGNDAHATSFARVYWTTDGGNHWRPSNPASGRTGPVDVVSANVVWLFGRLDGDGLRFPRLFRTTDAGRHWQSVHIPVAVSSGGGLDAISATLGFATSGSGLWRTTDGGHHWTAVPGVIAHH